MFVTSRGDINNIWFLLYMTVIIIGYRGHYTVNRCHSVDRGHGHRIRNEHNIITILNVGHCVPCSKSYHRVW